MVLGEMMVVALRRVFNSLKGHWETSYSKVVSDTFSCSIEVTVYSIQTPHTCSTHVSSIPAVSITPEDTKMFTRMQARGQGMEIELYLEAHTLLDVPSRNLIAGSKNLDEFVVLGGHTDS
jgi:hypothetical protein